MKKRLEFFKNGLVLTAVGLAMRSAGIFLGALVSRKVGAVGVGLNSLIMNVYSFALTFSTAGISLAATALTAAMIGRGEKKRAPEILRGAFLYSFIFASAGTVLLVMLSGRLGLSVIGDARARRSLIILAFSLIPSAISSVAGGYFIGVRKVSLNASLGAVGQVVRIALTVLLLQGITPENTAGAIHSLALGVTLTESTVAALALIELAVYHAREKYERGGACAFLPVFKKAFPLAASALVRSALLTLEHGIIPSRLLLFGNTGSEALAEYGYLHGMALPVILYPMVLLSSFSSLLVPEFAEAKAGGDSSRMERIAERALRAALAFGAVTFAFFLSFSEELGYLIYNSYDTGYYIAILAPVVPIMYLDHVADNMLKGIGEEVYSMWVNIADSLLSIILVFLLLPKMGIAGYALVIIIMEGFNFFLSFVRLKKRIKFSVKPHFSLAVPAALTLLSAYAARKLVRVRGEAVTVGIFLTEAVLTLAVLSLFGISVYAVWKCRLNNRVEHHHKRDPEKKSVG